MISEGLSSIPQISPTPSSIDSQPSFPEWNVEAPQFKNGKFIKPKNVTNTPLVESPQARNINPTPNTQPMLEGWEYILNQTYQKPKKKKINTFQEVKHWKKEGKQEELAPYLILKNTIQLISDVEFAVSRLDNENIGDNLKLEEFKRLMKGYWETAKYWESLFYKDRRKVYNHLSIELIGVVADYYGLAENNPEIVAYLEDERKLWDRPGNASYILTGTPQVNPGVTFLEED